MVAKVCFCSMWSNYK